MGYLLVRSLSMKLNCHVEFFRVTKMLPHRKSPWQMPAVCMRPMVVPSSVSMDRLSLWFMRLEASTSIRVETPVIASVIRISSLESGESFFCKYATISGVLNPFFLSMSPAVNARFARLGLSVCLSASATERWGYFLR